MNNFVNLDDLEKEKIKKLKDFFNRLKFESVQHYGYFNAKAFIGGTNHNLRKTDKKIVPDAYYVLNFIYSATDNNGAVPIGESLGISLHVSPVSINDTSPGFVNIKVSKFKTENLADYYLDIFTAQSNKKESKIYENVLVSKSFDFYEALISLETINVTLKNQDLSRNEKRYMLLALLGREFDLPISVKNNDLTESEKIKALERFKQKCNVPDLEATVKAFNDKYGIEELEDLETSPFYKKMEKLQRKVENLSKETRVLEFDFERTKTIWKQELSEKSENLSLNNIEEFDEHYLNSENRQNVLKSAKLLKENIEAIKKLKTDISEAKKGLEKYRKKQMLAQNLNTPREQLMSLLKSANDRANMLLEDYEKKHSTPVDNGFLKVTLDTKRLEDGFADFDDRKESVIEKFDSDFNLSTRYRNSLTSKKKLKM